MGVGIGELIKHSKIVITNGDNGVEGTIFFILIMHEVDISKRLIKLAKRWQKFAAIRRKRISFPSLYDDTHSCSTSSAVSKGHFVVYTADQKRFVIPLSYLENEIIRQLLNMSEEEFGLPSDGPITLPCDAVFMEYIISLLRRGLSTEVESALLVSVTSHRCSSAPLHQEGWRNQELLVC
nr:auxin-responsive protein SAUR68-like [Ipomoea trifida]